MKRRGVVVLAVFSLILFIVNADDIPNRVLGNVGETTINPVVNIGENKLIYTYEIKYYSSKDCEEQDSNCPCIQVSTSENAQNFFSFIQRGGIKTSSNSYCVSKKSPSAYIDIYISAPKNAELTTYHSEIIFKASSGTALMDIEKGKIIDNNWSEMTKELNRYFGYLSEFLGKCNKYPPPSECSFIRGNLDNSLANMHGLEKDITSLEKAAITAGEKGFKLNVEFQIIDSKKKIEEATSKLVELDRMILIPTEKSKELLTLAETKFNNREYEDANKYALEALKEMEAEKNNALKILAFLIIIFLIIGIWVWRIRKKTKVKEIIQESLPVPDTSSVEKEIISITPSEQERISKIDIPPTIIKEKEVSKKKEIGKKETLEEGEKFKDSTLRKLARQYADGEISKDKYERLKKILEE
jgi:hypothetical protein